MFRGLVAHRMRATLRRTTERIRIRFPGSVIVVVQFLLLGGDPSQLQSSQDPVDVGGSQATEQFFSGSTSTGCGAATAAVGPFYCPADQAVYIDLSFYARASARRAGRSPRPT